MQRVINILEKISKVCLAVLFFLGGIIYMGLNPLGRIELWNELRAIDIAIGLGYAFVLFLGNLAIIAKMWLVFYVFASIAIIGTISYFISVVSRQTKNIKV